MSEGGVSGSRVLLRRLREIMASIHTQCVEYGQDGDGVDCVKGANIAG